MRRLFFTLLVTTGTLMATQDARQIVAQSVANYEKDYRASLGYTYLQKDVETTEAGEKVTVSEVVVVEGLPFEKVISKDGRPLTPEEQRREDEKYQKALAERSSPEARAKKIAEFERQRQFIREVPDAYDFKIIGEEVIGGRANYVVECTPNPAYHPKDFKSRMFSHINAKLWIDKQDLRWTKADADVVAPISIGWVMARIGQGAKMSIRQQRVAPNVWMPTEVHVNGSARIMLVKNKSIGEQIYFSDYHPINRKEAAITETAALTR